MESNFPQTLKSNWIEMLLVELFECHLKRYVDIYCHVEMPKCLCVWSHETIEVLALLPSADTKVARKPKTRQGSPALRSCCAIVIQPWVHGTCFRHPLVWKEEWLWRDFVHQNWNVIPDAKTCQEDVICSTSPGGFSLIRHVTGHATGTNSLEVPTIKKKPI